MEPLTFFGVVFTASVVAGALGALLGLGGGVIIVPLLALMAGLNIHYAIGASIVSVIATSSGAAATYVRDRITNLRLGMFLEIATTTGAVAGALVAGILPGRVLSVVFGRVLGHAAWTMARSPQEKVPGGAPGSRLATRLRLHGAYYDPASGHRVEYQVRGVPQGFAMMWLAGVISGLLGIGSGVFKVIAMDLMMGVPLKVSTTTSNFMIGVTAAASAGIYFLRGDISPFIAAPVALGILLGTVAGTRLLLRLRGATIQRIFLVVLVVVAIQMIWRGIEGTVR
ncbi:MAG TPA: sulfite exporter TauE/SafE family protein [Candidatus Methylomirabilis sp.]|nr:sulfite exporter TauE/SafE family protein [Candidatus Methylomirabilis sp.]